MELVEVIASVGWAVGRNGIGAIVCRVESNWLGLLAC